MRHRVPTPRITYGELAIRGSPSTAGVSHGHADGCVHQSIFDLWKRFEDPLVYTPVDNETTDCHKKAEGGGTYNPVTQQIDYVLDANGKPVDYAKGDPVANLDLIRSTFFSWPGVTLGARKRFVFSQSFAFDRAHPTDAKFVENVIWADSDVLFVTINLPGGSNNDQDVWYGAPTETTAQRQAREERTGADLRWLDTVQLAEDDPARGLTRARRAGEAPAPVPPRPAGELRAFGAVASPPDPTPTAEAPWCRA